MFEEPITQNNQGCIEVICGSMFSGKTEELLRRLKRVQFSTQDFLLVKPIVDNRYHENDVVSHQGNSIKAVSVSSAQEILTLWKGQHVIGIDEVQFFNGDIVEVCTVLANKGVRVIVAGLDMDFLGNPFGAVPQLLSIAEYVTKVHAICVSCGSLAQYSHRTSSENDQVLLGAVEKYEPLCRSCYTKI